MLRALNLLLAMGIATAGLNMRTNANVSQRWLGEDKCNSEEDKCKPDEDKCKPGTDRCNITGHSVNHYPAAKGYSANPY